MVSTWLKIADKLGSETRINCLIEYNSVLYAGTGPNGLLYKFVDDEWVQVTIQYLSETDILSLAVFNGNLYAGTGPNGYLLVGNGSNASWELQCPTLVETHIYGLSVFNNKIYGSTGPNGKLLEYDGGINSTWTLVAAKLGSETKVLNLVIHNGKLYGGTFPNANLYEWNGSNAWASVAPQLNTSTSIFSLAVFNGKLYGSTSSATPPDHGALYEWDGVDEWVQVAPELGSEFEIVLAVYKKKLYGGTGALGKLYVWNGSSAWVEKAAQLTETYIKCLIVYNNELYGGTAVNGFLYKFFQYFPPAHPVYAVRLSGSSNWLGEPYNFGTTGVTNKVSSIRVKPGLTSAVGSFEVDFQDTGSTGNAFTGISLFDHVWVWLDYDATGSTPAMQGRIDTLETDFSESRGYIRKLIGRDYGESLLRILERRAFSGSASGSIVLMNDDASLNTNHKYIDNNTTVYNIVMDNDNVHKGMSEISDFVNKDFYVDEQKQLHWFTKQPAGTHAFVVGENILSYRVFNDISDCSNKVYVFGNSNADPVSGSYFPLSAQGAPNSFDVWTQQDTTGWSAFVNSGSEIAAGCASSNTHTKIGTYYMEATAPVDFSTSAWLGIRFNLPQRLMFNSGDTVNFWRIGEMLLSSGDDTAIRPLKLRLKTDASNYFETTLEETNSIALNWINYKIPLGPANEGVAATGSIDSNTGSYKWSRVGTPDWYNVTSFELASYNHTRYINDNVYLGVDQLYFATRFQGVASSSASQTSYGLREKIIKDDRYNSRQYCQNVADTFLSINSSSTRQIEILTTGSVDLIMGYTYPLTIPSEGLSAANYELIDLEHKFDASGFTSKCLFTDKKEISIPIPLINYPLQSTFNMKAFKDELDREANRIIGPSVASGWMYTY